MPSRAPANEEHESQRSETGLRTAMAGPALRALTRPTGVPRATSLADAEAREDPVEDLLDVHAAGDLAQGAGGQAEVLCGELRGVGQARPRPAQRFDGTLDREAMAGARQGRGFRLGSQLGGATAE